MADDGSERRTDLFVAGLRNAHALEAQALSIMKPQIARIEHYPEVAERLRLHVEETRAQIARLDELLDGFDARASRLKEAALSVSGGMAAAMHVPAGDEILRNTFANYAFEHFEIASYKALIVLAEDGGFARAQPLFRQTLEEEVAMARWIEEALPMVTRRYAGLYAKGGGAEAGV